MPEDPEFSLPERLRVLQDGQARIERAAPGSAPMKCPTCGAAELVRDTRDLSYTHNGETTVIPAVTADFCPACGESITDKEETERVMREMLAFDRRVGRDGQEGLN